MRRKFLILLMSGWLYTHLAIAEQKKGTAPHTPGVEQQNAAQGTSAESSPVQPPLSNNSLKDIFKCLWKIVNVHSQGYAGEYLTSEPRPEPIFFEEHNHTQRPREAKADVRFWGRLKINYKGKRVLLFTEGDQVYYVELPASGKAFSKKLWFKGSNLFLYGQGKKSKYKLDVSIFDQEKSGFEDNSKLESKSTFAKPIADDDNGAIAELQKFLDIEISKTHEYLRDGMVAPKEKFSMDSYEARLLRWGAPDEVIQKLRVCETVLGPNAQKTTELVKALESQKDIWQKNFSVAQRVDAIKKEDKERAEMAKKQIEELRSQHQSQSSKRSEASP